MSSFASSQPKQRRVGGLTPTQLERYARVMLWALEDARRNTGAGQAYAPGDVIQLSYQPKALRLVEKLYPLLLERGFIVALEPTPHFTLERLYYNHATERQLRFTSPWRQEMYRHVNGLIHLAAPESLTHLKDCEPAKLVQASLAQAPLRQIRNEREEAGLFAWTLSQMPTSALAAQAQMSYGEYAQEIARACYLNESDPVARWQDTMAKIGRVKRWLDELDIEWVHVKSDDGETNLKVWLGPMRRWLGGSGHNIPSFEVFISPQAGRAEGRYYANESSFKLGRHVRGVRLVFCGGEVFEATAEAEEDFVRSRVALDDGSKRIGEFSLTDRRFSEITRFMASTLYDENVGGEHGNCHIAIGNAYVDSYAGAEPLTAEEKRYFGFNESAEHWDLVTTSPRQVVARLKSGRELLIYADGQFTLPL